MLFDLNLEVKWGGEAKIFINMLQSSKIKYKEDNMTKVIVKSISQIDLAIFYESIDGSVNFVDQLETYEAWARQVQTILHLGRIQKTDEPVLEMAIGGGYD